ncbi:MAG: hypothetical protein COX62_04170 [Deltaproteobacteria bacterium CG_4_10_14_0_2_um_filter_43_8]|nr:MAG: hypothetical protein COV43_06430 [Deltaproteobacteria bacterium CG11_big_fil_rev_8_21_14_0_20_42_23]PJA20723.1 MAG: hypothetical protein COX62_04170 [Deltaproteobacteria bacterium CG_4_10_14_0_2_um_filter_43_8]PJC63394.1 MAG: hypothetical protein CO021_09745 [Deltaproteobacteria bacterium CG_4_9_14_0_2_um_filter_42_21]
MAGILQLGIAAKAPSLASSLASVNAAFAGRNLSKAPAFFVGHVSAPSLSRPSAPTLFARSAVAALAVASAAPYSEETAPGSWFVLLPALLTAITFAAKLARSQKPKSLDLANIAFFASLSVFAASVGITLGLDPWPQPQGHISELGKLLGSAFVGGGFAALSPERRKQILATIFRTLSDD